MLVVDNGREPVDNESGLEAGGAMDVLRAVVELVVVLVVVVDLVATVDGLATLAVDEVEGIFLTVGAEDGFVVVDEDKDDCGFEAVVGLV